MIGRRRAERTTHRAGTGRTTTYREYGAVGRRTGWAPTRPVKLDSDQLPNIDDFWVSDQPLPRPSISALTPITPHSRLAQDGDISPVHFSPSHLDDVATDLDGPNDTEVTEASTVYSDSSVEESGSDSSSSSSSSDSESEAEKSEAETVTEISPAKLPSPTQSSPGMGLDDSSLLDNSFVGGDAKVPSNSVRKGRRPPARQEIDYDELWATPSGKQRFVVRTAQGLSPGDQAPYTPRDTPGPFPLAKMAIKKGTWIVDETPKRLSRQEILAAKKAPTPGLRRSRRARIAPVNAVVGEEAVYGQDRTLLGVTRIRTLDPVDALRMKRKPSSTVPVAATSEDLAAVQPRYLDANGEEIEGDAPLATAVPAKSTEDWSLYGPEGVVEYEEYYNAPANERPEVTARDCPALDTEYFRSGTLIVAGHSAKPAQEPSSLPLMFIVLQGTVTVTIHKTEMTLKAGSQFYVPPGNSYEIVNENKSDARIVYILVDKDGPGEGEEEEADAELTASAIKRSAKAVQEELASENVDPQVTPRQQRSAKRQRTALSAISATS